MIESSKLWLAAVPWESVLTLNIALCQAQKFEPLTQPKGLEKARRLWEQTISKPMSLRETFDFCHQVHDLAPFTFNNGNTFAAIGRTLVEDLLKQVPPVEAQILRTTIGHYIVGLISRRELHQVLRHLGPLLDRAGASLPAPAPAAPAQPDAPSDVPLSLPQRQGA